MKFISMLLLLALPIAAFAQKECTSTTSEPDKIMGNVDGKYILLLANQKGATPYSKIFDAATGKLLYKYPTREGSEMEQRLGFHNAVQTSAIRNDHHYVFYNCYGLRTDIDNEKEAGKVYGTIERDYLDMEKHKSRFRLKFPDGSYMKEQETMNSLQYYYDIDRQRGLLYFNNATKKGYTNYVYLIKPGQTPQKLLSDNNDDYNLKNLFVNPDGSMIILPSGQVIDMVKEKVVKKKRIFYGYSITTDYALISADGQSLATGDMNGQMVIYNLDNYKPTNVFPLPASMTGHRYTIVPLADMKSYAVKSDQYEHDVFIVRDGVATVLCDPNAAEDKEDYDQRMKDKYARLNAAYEKERTMTADKAEAAYIELLDYIKLSDEQFAPYAQRIISAGKDAWILYGAREKALKILNNQENAINGFINKAGKFLDKSRMSSLTARLVQISNSRAKIPKN